MKRMLLAGAALAAFGFAGIGHNMPPAYAPQTAAHNQGVLPRRVVDENRRNQKLKQKLRRAKHRQYLLKHNRFERKSRKFGPGYRPGKLFKGHRI